MSDESKSTEKTMVNAPGKVWSPRGKEKGVQNAQKRKSDAEEASSLKKSRTSHSSAKALIKTILAHPDTYPIPDNDEDIRQSLVELAQYAKELEQDVQQRGAGSAPKAMSADQVAAAVEKIRKAANSGIKKQMTVVETVMQGSGTAKWSYDGVCADPVVFGTMLGLGGPPTWKMHKMPIDDFENRIGHLDASARYSDLYLKGQHVNIRWNDSGEFKFSGTYGA
ncbi:hypothetical protein EV702DRAFT_1274422 [Suillus placidus]|uniref:Uncharacterized protein n=1 Tax=Suillus placidus TaxID=48579 RepID=A0A9P7A710_9AGAM|nr:hypothetical protein EV702DRAFT_1283569 [Suillus placidus]KAG1782862.1 hypothetical protein EV702DRAFT_1274422 [Suillus placidus]